MINFIKNIFNAPRKLKELRANHSLLNAKYHKLMDMKTAESTSLKERIEFLEDELQRASSPVATKTLSRLKFYSLVPGAHQGPVETEFTLGLGRCGKVVEELELKLDETKLVITQWHDDGSYKLFTYLRQDIIGRIQECHEVVDVVPGSFHMERVRRREMEATLFNKMQRRIYMR